MTELHFLFTDIEGSTRLWEREPEGMAVALRDHDALLRAAVESNSGAVFKTVGDAVCAVFQHAANAAAAAADGQRSLSGREWPKVGPLKVRMAIHSGPAEGRDGDWFGPTLNRVARALAAGHGGQILLSGRTRELLGAALPGGTRAVDLGERRLKDLREPERLWQLSLDEGPQAFPPLRTLDARAHNLPVHPSPLIGRDEDVMAVSRAFDDPGTRLLTLTGPGGVGKTRLAQQVAAELVDRFADGAWFVPLAALAAVSEVAPAIFSAMQPAAALEAADGDAETALLGFLREREALLVLDNAEHIADAAPFIASVLAGSPLVRIIATSRAALRVRAEREFPVDPLALPVSQRDSTWQPGRYPAMDLFVERAKAVHPSFEPDAAASGAIVAICRALDGLPLAIELAAARSRLLAPAALLARLGERLPLLTGGARDLPARQRTMRDAIAWSVDLLAPEEQLFFARLAVFHGGASIEAIEAVLPAGVEDFPIDPLDGTALLAEQSLVRLATGAAGDRVGMLETIREYAAGMFAGDAGAVHVRDRHARWFLELAERAAEAWGAQDEAVWMARLAADQGNLRAALGWLSGSDLPSAVRLGAALGRFWRVRGAYSEGRTALAPLVALAANADSGAVGASLRADLLNATASLAEFQRDYAAAEAWFGDALALAETANDTGEQTRALMGLGRIAQSRGELARAGKLHRRVMEVSRAAGNEQDMAYSMMNLGIVAAIAGNAAEGERWLRESLAILVRLGDVGAMAAGTTSLGALLFEQGDVDRAVELWEDALEAWQGLEDKARLADTLANLGEASVIRGDREKAAVHLRQALDLHEEAGDLGSAAYDLAGLGAALAWSEPEHAAGLLFDALGRIRDTGLVGTEAIILEALAATAAAAGAGRLAARLLGAAAGLRRQSGIPLAPVYRPVRSRTAVRARELAGEREFRVNLSDGRKLGPGAAAAEALEWWKAAAAAAPARPPEAFVDR